MSVILILLESKYDCNNYFIMFSHKSHYKNRYLYIRVLISLCINQFQTFYAHLILLGTLHKDDYDGSENGGKKVNLCSSNSISLDPLNMSKYKRLFPELNS